MAEVDPLRGALESESRQGSCACREVESLKAAHLRTTSCYCCCSQNLAQIAGDLLAEAAESNSEIVFVAAAVALCCQPVEPFDEADWLADLARVELQNLMDRPLLVDIPFHRRESCRSGKSLKEYKYYNRVNEGMFTYHFPTLGHSTRTTALAQEFRGSEYPHVDTSLC